MAKELRNDYQDTTIETHDVQHGSQTPMSFTDEQGAIQIMDFSRPNSGYKSSKNSSSQYNKGRTGANTTGRGSSIDHDIESHTTGFKTASRLLKRNEEKTIADNTSFLDRVSEYKHRTNME